jgi:uncharacterized protein
MMKQQSDVLIIGGGISGIVAAQELLEAGKSVMILDRDSADNFGGLARESFGGMFFVDTPDQRKAGIKDSQEIAFQDWCTFGELGPEDGLSYEWAMQYVERTTPDVYDWVKKRGIGFLPVMNWVERGFDIPGNSLPRFHMVWGTGQELTDQLAKHMRTLSTADNLAFRFNARVSELVFTNGRVTGCRGEDEKTGEAFEYAADAVVIAAGGLNGSDKVIRDNWHPDWGTSPPEKILCGSHKYADGLMHDATQAIGGSVVNVENNWNYAAGISHPRPRKPRHGLSLVPCKTALWMDATGRRIGPRPLIAGFDTREVIKRICAVAEEKNIPKYSWQIMNRKIMLKEFAISGAESNRVIRDKSKLGLLKNLVFGNSELVDATIRDSEDIVTASSVAELADKMKPLNGDTPIDASGMAEDIAAYDVEMRRGPDQTTDDQIKRIAELRQYKADKLRTCKFQPIDDRRAGPLVAIRTYIISRKSLGGIQTDLDSRVLDISGQAIEGLYAAGEATGFGGGGVHGMRALEGTFLGGCVFSARVAASTIIRGHARQGAI